MLTRRLLALAIATAAATAGLAGPAVAQSPVTAEQAAQIGKEAYDYGFPLLEFTRVKREMTSVKCPDTSGNAPVNSFSNAAGFATPDSRTVVAPNTDTLYSIAHLDLSKGPIVLSHPDMGKRYYSFQMLDPYTNVIDIPGLREDGPKAGSYVIKLKGDSLGKKKPKGARVFKSRYDDVWVIGRTLATDAEDQRKAQKLMAKYSLTRLNGKPARKLKKNCKPGEPSKFPTPTDGPGFASALSAAMTQSPPPKRDGAMLDKLASVGIGIDQSVSEAGLSPDAEAALYKGIAEEAAALPGRVRLKAFTDSQASGGWLSLNPRVGDYGTDYELRAFVAVVGLGANTPDEAIYPTGITDATGALYSGADDYRLTFPPGQAPPAKYFWSLTLYDSSGYLVANPANRYTVGPTHEPFVTQPDGSIVVAIQGTEPSDPTVNWLPSPPGNFRLSLRLYGPSESAQSGAWKPPGVVKVP